MPPWMDEGRDALVARLMRVRRATMRAIEPLSAEDMVVQSMPDASPTKWHLAHTTWFFERFVLGPLGVAPMHPGYEYLFNSYYEAIGERHPRPKRGLLSRPSLDDVLAYRHHVDARLSEIASASGFDTVKDALELGAHHEEQHQELLLTDIKHLFSENAMSPVYRSASARPASSALPLTWHAVEGGTREIGAAASGFAFDNERPRHRVHVAHFEMASRLVTAGEYLAFVRDGGYREPRLWLSDGWNWRNANAVHAPLYWHLGGDETEIFTLTGRRPLAEDEPVCHVSYYEADAYARWVGARLPTESEWELAADAARANRGSSNDGAFAEDALHPTPARGTRDKGIAQMLGDTWEWTSSAYAPYPGYVPFAGAFGEYNGKFMVNQMVLRGGSCATPREHIRTTYRNFFPPQAAWQFSGIRLARNA